MAVARVVVKRCVFQAFLISDLTTHSGFSLSFVEVWVTLEDSLDCIGLVKGGYPDLIKHGICPRLDEDCPLYRDYIILPSLWTVLNLMVSLHKHSLYFWTHDLSEGT